MSLLDYDEVAHIETKDPAPVTLTPAQDAMWRFLAKYISRFGYAPTVAEICEHFQYESTHSARKLLKQLDRKGYIYHQKYVDRGIKLLKRPEVIA